MPSHPINLYDFEALARAKMSSMAFDYYASGAHDEITLRDNHDAYDRIKLRYRVLRDVSRRTTETAVLGHPLRMPVLVAPTAFHKLAHPDGARLAVEHGAAGIIVLWGLAADGQSGVEQVLEILRFEFDLAMGLCGCASVEEIERDMIG